MFKLSAPRLESLEAREVPAVLLADQTADRPLIGVQSTDTYFATDAVVSYCWDLATNKR